MYIYQIVKIVDHNFQLDMRRGARVRVFCLDDLDICAVSLAPISMVTSPAGILAIKFHDLCWSMDCIQPIVHCMQQLFACHALPIDFAVVAVAFVVNENHLNSSSMKIVPALGSNRQQMRTATAQPTTVAVAVYYNRPVNRAIGISLAHAGIDSDRSFDACPMTLTLEW